MGANKKELLEQLDQVPTYVQQLQFTVKMPTVGKSATFSKVDSVINETKTLMNVISKVVTTCFVCATKVSVSGEKPRKSVSFCFHPILKRLVLYTVQCFRNFRKKFQYKNHCFLSSNQVQKINWRNQNPLLFFYFIKIKKIVRFS